MDAYSGITSALYGNPPDVSCRTLMIDLRAPLFIVNERFKYKANGAQKPECT